MDSCGYDVSREFWLVEELSLGVTINIDTLFLAFGTYCWWQSFVEGKQYGRKRMNLDDEHAHMNSSVSSHHKMTSSCW
jgi:hypothetical protein